MLAERERGLGFRIGRAEMEILARVLLHKFE